MTRLFLKLVMTAILAAGMVSAQRNGGGGKGGDTMTMSMPETPNRFDQISSLLKLNKDQKKLLKTTMDEGQKEAVSLRDQILKTQLELGDAVAAGKDQQVIDQAANALAALEAKMTVIEMKAFAKIYNALEKDQQSTVGPVFLMMHGAFRGKNWMDAKS